MSWNNLICWHKNSQLLLSIWKPIDPNCFWFSRPPGLKVLIPWLIRGSLPQVKHADGCPAHTQHSLEDGTRVWKGSNWWPLPTGSPLMEDTKLLSIIQKQGDSPILQSATYGRLSWIWLGKPPAAACSWTCCFRVGWQKDLLNNTTPYSMLNTNTQKGCTMAEPNQNCWEIVAELKTMWHSSWPAQPENHLSV